MSIDLKEYRLRCELRGHENDVRGITVTGNDTGIATSSIDKTVRLWTQDDRKFVSSHVLVGHTNSVGPITWIPPNHDLPYGGVASGGMDTLVLVWDLNTGHNFQTLQGHQSEVTGIAFDDGDLISSSIDSTLRRWRNGKCIETWAAHKEPIQAVIKLPTGELVTGSNDTTLKTWKGNTCLHTFVGHSDTVHGLAVMSDLGILSASHDGSLKLWAVSGEVLMEMVGHTAPVYSVDSHASGLIVSGSVDGFAKIWKDGLCIQNLEHPGGVYDVKFLRDGDIVTACSDGIVRIWTVNQDYFADQLKYKSSRKTVGGLKLEELPALDALKIPGTFDGQTKVVKEGDNGVVYAWNMAKQKWDKSESTASPTTLSDIPSVLLEDILCHLSVQDILKSRCVSKQLKSVSYTESFIKKQLNSVSSPHAFLSFTTSSTIFNMAYRRPGSFFDGDAQVTLQPPINIEFALIQVVGSDKGLICLVESDHIIVWNPSIQKSKILSNFTEDKPALYGFGCGTDLNFKFVSIFETNYKGKECSMMWIATLGSNAYWNNINRLIANEFDSFDPIGHGKLVEGCLNWMMEDSIISLDLSKEMYKKLAKPKKDGNYKSELLGVWRDSLGILFRGTEVSEVSIMKEYGKSSSWLNLLIIPHMELCGSPYINDIYYISNNKVLLSLMEEFQWKIKVYDTRDNSFKPSDIQMLAGVKNVEIYTESLISP